MIELKNVKNYLAPLPVILITSRLQEGNINKDNIAAISWAGICDNTPHLININIAKGKYSGQIIKMTKEFGVCIPTSKHIKEIDICGSTHGNAVNKFEITGFTSFEAKLINVPLIQECPINMECTLEDVISFESHEMFTGKIIKTYVDENILDANGKPDFGKIDLLAYLNDEYWTLGRKLGNLFYTGKK
ncbi:MAG: flavin reductase family protein [Actinobacteria bacterium]|nr:flavin reductase family protein [Cyanobacteriota bacterium]MCL5771686.1 flavin reductase family protein [Actinomycetota bacterium]